MKDVSQYDLKDKDGAMQFAGDVGVDFLDATGAIVTRMPIECRVQYWGALLSALSGGMSADLGAPTAVAVLRAVSMLIQKESAKNDAQH